MAEGAGLSFKSLLKIFNITNPVDTSTTPRNLYSLTRYTASELDKIFPTEVVPSQSPIQDISASNVLMYTRATQENVAKVKYDTEAILKLAPEIRKAKHILVSSILSPNDLQEGTLGFRVEVPELTQPTCDKIAKRLCDYFNNDFKINNKLAKYIGEALFGAGAFPILILPHRNLQSLIKDAKLILSEERLTMLNVDTTELVSTLSNATIYPRKSSKYYKLNDRKTTVDTITKNTFIACESYIDSYNTTIAQKRSSITRDLNVRVPSSISKKSCLVSLEKITESMINDLESGDFIKFTDNPQIIRIGHDVLDKKKKEMKETIEKYLTDTTPYKTEPALSIIDKEEKDPIGHPLYIELSAESCIPVCIPGYKDKHIGYFIICDENGTPVQMSRTLYENWYDSAGATQSITAMYGTNSPLDLLKNIDQGRYNIAKTMSHTVFNQVLDKYLSDHLSDIGFDGAHVSKIDSISTCMFYRLLTKKRTQILFVPDSLITYYCFEYRDDGTGKNKIEDVMWILSLRTTFLVASIMAMANDAIDHKQIQLTLAKQTENVEQLIEQIAYAYIEKHRMRFNVNPNEISRDIAAQALSIVPTNYPGLDNFSISDPETKRSETNKADSDFLDRLTDLVKDYLGVPSSILDKVDNDEEFATAIVSKNLFFGKEILNYQSILSEHNDKIIRNYTLFSSKLKKEILTIVNDNLNIDNVKLDDGSYIDKNQDLLYKKIVDGITTFLPTPSIAVDKAQYAEISEYINSTNGLVDALYPSEILGNVSDDASSALDIIKARIKTDLLRTFMKKLNITSNLDIPKLEDITLSTITEDMQILHNYGIGIKEKKEIILTPPEDSEDTSYDSTGGDTSGDSVDFNF